jgi:hypothetical protein
LFFPEQRRWQSQFSHHSTVILARPCALMFDDYSACVADDGDAIDFARAGAK